MICLDMPAILAWHDIGFWFVWHLGFQAAGLAASRWYGDFMRWHWRGAA